MAAGVFFEACIQRFFTELFIKVWVGMQRIESIICKTAYQNQD